MFNFLHTYTPTQIIFSLGPVKIYWYGLFLVLGIISALAITKYLAKLREINQTTIDDLAFWLIINSIIGARIYDVVLEYKYYSQYPLNIIKIWQGGLAIHGAIIAGALTVLWYVKKHLTASGANFWKFTALIVPGLALGQAIGRWGNYFNQELFGGPTALPWGIPIDLFSRPSQFINEEFFHPTFLYESLGNLLIFLILFFLTKQVIKRGLTNLCQVPFEKFIVLFYLILYSLLRFSLEYIRIDSTITILGWRWPQIISAGIIFFCTGYLTFIIFGKKNANISTETLDQP